MKLIIHDLDELYNEKIIKKISLDKKEVRIISDDNSIKQCVGCFGCWVKTPGQCVLKDKYNQMGALLGSTEELIIISQTIYGTYSPFVRNILDRSLPYIHPDFVKRNGEMHHKKRYDNRINVKVYFYGDATKEEKETAEKLVKANIINFNGIVEDIKFIDSKEKILDESCFN